jgi:hypothetical protein
MVLDPSVAVIDLQVGEALPVSSIQRNCPGPEQLKAIPGALDR